MTPHLKKDFKTILEVLAYSIVSLGLGFFYTNLPWWLATPTISQRIKRFLEENLHKGKITITDKVINAD
ncbi:hypothetical protein BH09BAC6_BH09BAC6_36440 [soil metagenome]|jgi:hypothetical protein